jgi:hypothetical protein
LLCANTSQKDFTVVSRAMAAAIRVGAVRTNTALTEVRSGILENAFRGPYYRTRNITIELTALDKGRCAGP